MGAALGAASSIGSVIGGLFGHSSAKDVPHAPSAYQYTGQAQADQNVQGGINQLNNSTVPAAIQTQHDVFNNPGTAGAQTGANFGSMLGKLGALGQFQQGGGLINTGNSLTPYANMALYAGFDPQGSVYKQQQQQNTEQQRALLEARGIDSTPYGAGVENQGNLNFNNAWLQNTLARQTQGAQTAGVLLNQGLNDINAGVGMQNAAGGNYANSAMMPYNLNQLIAQNKFGALQASQGLQQTGINDWLQYLNQANQASQTATNQQQTNLNQANSAFNQNQQLGQNLGSGLAGLGKAFGNTGIFGGMMPKFYS